MPVGLKRNMNYGDFRQNIKKIVSENPELVQEIKTVLLDEQKTAAVISPQKTGRFAKFKNNLLRRIINFDRNREFFKKFKTLPEEKLGTVQIPLKNKTGGTVSAEIVSRSYTTNINKGRYFGGQPLPEANVTEEVIMLKRKNKILGRIFIEKETDKLSYSPISGEFIPMKGCLTVKHIDSLCAKYENVFELLTQTALERAIPSRKLNGGITYFDTAVQNFITGRNIEESCLGSDLFRRSENKGTIDVLTRIANENGFLLDETPRLLLERIEKDGADLPALTEKLNQIIAGKK